MLSFGVGAEGGGVKSDGIDFTSESGVSIEGDIGGDGDDIGDGGGNIGDGGGDIDTEADPPLVMIVSFGIGSLLPFQLLTRSPVFFSTVRVLGTFFVFAVLVDRRLWK